MPANEESPIEDTIALVQKAQHGDRSALDSLFERYLPRVRRIVGVRMGRTAKAFEDLEDVVQDSLLDAFRGLARFEPRSEGSFCNWLARCVENNVKDHLRRGIADKRGGGRVKSLADIGASTWADSVFAATATTASQAARGKELDEQVEAALLRMAERDREVIILRAVCGMSAAETAAAMGIASEASAQKLFERARNRLADLLGS